METATTRYIKDALAGGWQPHTVSPLGGWTVHTVLANYYHQPTALLIPDAWRAVGKTRGWDEQPINYSTRAKILGNYKPEWLYQQHRVIDALADGKDINTALEGIES